MHNILVPSAPAPQCNITHKPDRDLVILASYLHKIAHEEFGPGLVRCKCVSLADLANMTDGRLLEAGISSLGARRRLQRHIRTDLESLLVSAESGAAAVRPGAERIFGKPATATERLRIDPDDAKHESREGFHEPWKVTSAACLLGMDPQDARTHSAQQCTLTFADGSELLLSC